jgi:microcin C transport system substrate-binding protein
MDMTFATLMSRADEPDAMYGLAARSVQISDDGLTYRFTMRPEARFHDGSKLTAHDVVFSLTTLKEKGHPHHPGAAARLRQGRGPDDRDGGRALSRRKACARRAAVRRRACRSSPSAYYATRAFEESTSMFAARLGPYKVGRFEANRYVEFDRVKDWWGADLPVSRGSYNFDTVRYEFYRDRDVAFEGFTSQELSVPRGVHLPGLGDALRFPRGEGWPRQARDPPDDTPSGAQGWFINMRRDKFKEPKLREALINAFDFEWTNKTIMYGSYDADGVAVPELRHGGGGAAVTPKSSCCSSRSAARSPTRCSASPSCRRCPTAPARTARCCARRCNC